MKRLPLLLSLILAISLISIAFGQTPEDEKIAKSLYLKASAAIRAENYEEAVRLLTQILDEYSESEVALQADQKLSEISEQANLAGLPKTPGFYWVENSGKISEMVTKPMKEGSPYPLNTIYATFSQEELPEIFADELRKFIVYRPKGSLKEIYWTSLVPLLDTDAKGQQVPSGNYMVQKDWEVQSVVGSPFGSSKIVFEEIKPGMWEVGFPTVFSPSLPVACGLLDGSGNVGLLIVQSKMVHSFYPFLEFWDKGRIDFASSHYIDKQLAKHLGNPDLLFFDAVLTYKTAYKKDQPKTEVAVIARKALELSRDNPITPKVLGDLNILLQYCVTDSVVRANSVHQEDAPEVKSRKNEALKSYHADGVPTDLFWVREQVARNQAGVGEYDEAIVVADGAVEAFKKKKPNTGSSLLGGIVTVKVATAKPDVPESFDIHDALSCYTLEPEWERIKDLKKEMESERFLARALELKANGGDAKEIEQALKEAKGKNNDNIRCYEAMIDFYGGSGRAKDVETAEKDIEKAKKRMTELAIAREG